jgi:hypothetical protein
MTKMLFLVVWLLLIEKRISLKPPSNLPSSSLLPIKSAKGITDTKLLPILNLAMSENRIHMLGKGESMNMLETLLDEMTTGVVLNEEPDFKGIWQPIIKASFPDGDAKWQDLPDRVQVTCQNLYKLFTPSPDAVINSKNTHF